MSSGCQTIAYLQPLQRRRRRNLHQHEFLQSDGEYVWEEKRTEMPGREHDQRADVLGGPLQGYHS